MMEAALNQEAPMHDIASLHAGSLEMFPPYTGTQYCPHAHTVEEM